VSAFTDSAWRVIMLGAGLVPTIHRSPVLGVRIPWAVILMVLFVGTLLLIEFLAAKRILALQARVLVGVLLLLPMFFALTRRVARLAQPDAIHLVPNLRRDATIGLVMNGLMFSLVLASLLLAISLQGYHQILVLLPVFLLSLVSDFPQGRLRGLLWLLILPAALCAVWLGSIKGVMLRPNDSILNQVGIVLGLWMVFATTLGMVGLVYVKPFATIGLSVIWIWLMRDPLALMGFNFNLVLGVIYEMFTQTGTHTLTAIATFGTLWYWLLGRKGDKVFGQRRAEHRMEGAATGALDLAKLAPSSSFLMPYRHAMKRALASVVAAPGGRYPTARYLSLAMGPSLNWTTLGAIAVATVLLWTAFLLALPLSVRADLVSGQVSVIVLLFAVVMLDIAIKQYGKRKAEIDLLSLAPMALSGRRLRAALARHAAGFIGAGIGMLALVIWVPRLLFGGPAEEPIKEASDLLSLFMIGICAFSLLLGHLLPAGPISGDTGFIARGAIVLLAIMPLIISRGTRLSVESQLLVQSVLLVGWGIFAWWECRRRIRARPAD
jgi:hypothetical protein